MAEYLSPGVYIEEQDFRSSTIEGVSTTTTGFTGPCLWGPVTGEPVLVTSFEEFRSRFGGLDPLNYGGTMTTNYLAFAVRSFFDNGGRRCFVSRIEDNAVASSAILDTGSGAGAPPPKCHFRARYPGLAGDVEVRVRVMRGDDRLAGGVPTGVRKGDILEFSDGASPLGVGEVSPTAAIVTANLRIVDFDASGNIQLLDATNTHNDPGFAHAQRVTIQVMVVDGSGAPATYPSLSAHHSSLESIERVMRTEDVSNGVEPPFDRTAKVWFDAPQGMTNTQSFALLTEFVGSSDGWEVFNLTGGSDGDEPDSGVYEDGLSRLGEIEDIAIVAAPAAWHLADAGERQAVRNALITHCETLKYRFAILADARGATSTEIMNARAKHDTTYAALYYPWVVVPDPFGSAGQTLELPPDGFVAGIYGRSDIETGVHKAPANEIVRGALRFNRNVTQGEQDILNPAGINCLRYFEGRGYLVWGARTMSSDPLWKYVNVRRLFIFLEHSIDRATQWAVFEPNNESLWLRVRLTVEAFLRNIHTTGALMGSTPQDAFFVKCDRTTMSLSDLDNGRLICLVGVAPTRPAEFVIFRIGQWTAEASLI